MLLRKFLAFRRFVRPLCAVQPQPEVLVQCSGPSLISCSFLMDDRQHSVASTPSNSLARFQDKLATAVNSARRLRVAKAIRKGRTDVEQPENVSVTLLDATGRPLDAESSVEDAFQDGCRLQVGRETFLVVRDPPQVSGLSLPKVLLSGCPLFLSFRAEYCSPESCEVLWSVRSKPSSEPPPPQANWEPFHSGPSVQFGAEHVGLWVKATVVPKNEAGREGLVKEVVGHAAVQEGPASASPIRARHARTARRTDVGGIRLASYNLLADFYANSDYSRMKLFPHCDPRFLDFQYRQQVILWELQNYNADLLCLQEVDKDFFARVLQPFFAPNFEAVFLPKVNLKREGLAVLFRREKLQLVRDLSLPSLTDALPDLQPHLPPVELQNTPAFRWRWEERNQVLLALLMRSTEDSSRLLLVGNTHLYSFPSAANIRLLQAGLVLKHLELARLEALRSNPAASCAVLLAGDFNSPPTSAVFDLATAGRTPAAPPDWFSGGEDEFFGCPALQHDLQLQSLYDAQRVITTLVPGFCAAVDHVFFAGLKLKEAVQLPELRQLLELTALPNRCFPSDHLALVGELEWEK